MPELEGLQGMSVSDHISKKWKQGMCLVVNDVLMIKHRYKGGETAVKNNVQKSGISIATGHDHSLRVWQINNYAGTSWGMTTGMLSDKFASSFRYTEMNPNENWCPGFMVVRVEGNNLNPEPVSIVTDQNHKRYGQAWFRGQWVG